jgi:hypothetical protein
LVSRIEKSIVALNLGSQGQFIALTNAMEMHLASGAPISEVVGYSERRCSLSLTRAVCPRIHRRISPYAYPL